MSWVEIYKPKNLKEVKIDFSKLMQLKRLVLEKKPVILYGNTGTGKTCSIYALANDLGYEVVEINASELRNRENVDLVIGNASMQQSLFKFGKILLVDEIDALTEIDRGGSSVLLEIINKSKSPIVFTANDPYNSKLSSIRKKCKLIELDDVKVYDMIDVLKRILKKEKIRHNSELLLKIAKESKGDLRAAINDLQASCSGRKELKELYLSEREKKQDIFRSLRMIFKRREVNGVADRLSVDYDELLLWLEENLPREYSGKALANGFDALSEADIFRARIKKQNYWRFLVYIKDLLTYGVALSKKHGNNRFTSYKRGNRILKYWIAKQKNLKKKEISEKLAKSLHTSSKKIIKDFYFYDLINSGFKIF